MWGPLAVMGRRFGALLIPYTANKALGDSMLPSETRHDWRPGNSLRVTTGACKTDRWFERLRCVM